MSELIDWIYKNSHKNYFGKLMSGNLSYSHVFYRVLFYTEISPEFLMIKKYRVNFYESALKDPGCLENQK